MSKNWYPVIDIMSCYECGVCISSCKNGVYDKTKAPSPLVKNPNECIEKCHECGNKCPVGAIIYIGDNTGWIPPVLKKADIDNTKPDCGCCCGCGSHGG